MSYLLGGNPQVFLCSNVTNGKSSITDQVAVNLLLNNTSSLGWSNTTVTALNTSNLVISMATNKSLIVSYNNTFPYATLDSIPGPGANINITGNNAIGGDYMYYNHTASDILMPECFSYLSVPAPITSTPLLGGSYIMGLSEQPTSQATSDALNYLRILNLTNTLSDGFSINLTAANVTNALGVEGKVFYWNGNPPTGYEPYYQNITNYQPMSTRNIALTYDAFPSNNGTYEMIQLNWNNPTFYPSANWSGAVSALTFTNFSNGYPNGTSYVGFAGSLNYTGTVTNINQIATSTLTINFTNYDPMAPSTAYIFTNPLTRYSGYTLMNVYPGYTGIPNFNSTAQLSQGYGNYVTVNYYAGTYMFLDQGQPNPPVFGNQTAIQVTDYPTAGTNADNLTVCFNSTERSNVYTNGGFVANQNLTASIVYAYDFNNNFSTSLVNQQLTSSTVAYNATTLAKWTRSANGITPILPVDAVTGALAQPGAFIGQLGMALTPASGSATDLYIQNLTITSNSDLIGYINPSGQYNLTLPLNLTTTFLPYLLYNSTFLPYGSGDALYNSSNGTYLNLSGLYMDPNINQGKIGYGIINGSIGSDFLSANASLGMRFLFKPKLAVDQISVGGNASLSVSDVNITGAGPTMLWSNSSNIVAYAPTYYGNGPVSYENWPSSNDYVQSYELVFPETYELRGGNLRPQAVLVNGVDALGSTTQLPSNVQKSTTLSNYNFSGFCVQNCGNVDVNTSVLQVYTEVIIPITLSGMQGGLITQNGGIFTTNIAIPITYQVNITNGLYTWPNGKPTLTLWYQFPSTRTHNLEFQGISPSGTSYQNLATISPSIGVTSSPPSGSWEVDLRQSSDILFFRRYSGPIVDYNVNICLYPQTQTTSVNTYPIYNVAYTFPVGTSGSADWSGVIANVRGPNAQYLQGLSRNNLSGFFANQNIIAQPLIKNVNIFDTLVGNTDIVNIVYNNITASAGFNVTIVFPNITQYNGKTYFETMSDHLMSLSADGVSQPSNQNVTGGNMLFTTRNGPYMIDSGVYVNGNSNYTASNVGSLAFNVTLMKDQYWAIAYPGQNTTTNAYNVTGYIPDLANTSSVLVGNDMYDSTGNLIGSTAGLNTLIVRGYPTTCYGYDRTSTVASAAWGTLNQTITIDPPGPGQSTLLSFDFNQGLTMNFNMSIQPAQYTYNNVSTTFLVAKTMIWDLTYTDYQGQSTTYPGFYWNDLNATGTLFANMVDSYHDFTLENVPWLDLGGLNNIFYPNLTQMNVTIQYTQGPVKTSIAPFNCTSQSTTALGYVQTAPFNTTQSYTDYQIATSATNGAGPANYSIQRDSTVYTFSPNYMLRNTTGAFYVDIAPIDARLSWRNASGVGVGNVPGRTTNYALLYNSSQMYPLVADGVNVNYLLTTPDLEPFRNAIRVAGAGVTALNISGNWIYNPNLVTLKGVQQNGASVFNVTTVYFSNQNLAAPTATGHNLVWNTTTSFPGVPTPPFAPVYKVSFTQNGATLSSGDEVALVFSSNVLLPTWNNGYQYNNASLCVAPDQSVVLNHYDLAWNMNPSTLKLQPTVYKYSSIPSNYNYFGVTGDAFNIYDGQSIGYVNAVNIANVSVLQTSANNFANVFANLTNMYPYLAIGDTYYPAQNSNNVTNATFVAFNTSSVFNITANSDMSYKVVDTHGRDLWEQYFIVPADNFTDAKVVNVFNKDQMVVVGPGSGNSRPLMMRVGPDGVLYTSDVSAYGYLATNIPSGAAISYDGVNAPLINSNVNLGQF